MTANEYVKEIRKNPDNAKELFKQYLTERPEKLDLLNNFDELYEDCDEEDFVLEIADCDSSYVFDANDFGRNKLR